MRAIGRPPKLQQIALDVTLRPTKRGIAGKYRDACMHAVDLPHMHSLPQAPTRGAVTRNVERTAISQKHEKSRVHHRVTCGNTRSAVRFSRRNCAAKYHNFV